MLKVEIKEAQTKGEDSVYTIGFRDPRCPNGRPLSFLMTTSWEGLNAIAAGIDLLRQMTDKCPDLAPKEVEIREATKGSTPYVRREGDDV